MKLYVLAASLFLALVAQADITCVLIGSPKKDNRTICDLYGHYFSYVKLGIGDKAVCSSNGKATLFDLHVFGDSYDLTHYTIGELSKLESPMEYVLGLFAKGSISGGIGSGRLESNVDIPGTNEKINVRCQ